MSRRDPASARVLREAPYIGDHVASRSARNQEPRTFAALLRWFLEGFWAETPEQVHAAGVWFGRPARTGTNGRPIEDIPPEQVGGSQLGAPKQAEPFRQLIENSPRQAAGDGPEEHYVRPMRAALARLAGHHSCTARERCDPDHVCGDGPLMARFLLQIAYAQGDWRSVSERWFPAYPVVHRSFAEQALRRLYSGYRPDPPARYEQTPGRPGWVDQSEAQRAAIQAGEKGVA